VIKETLLNLVVSIGLLAACAFAGDRELQKGWVRGVVFTADANRSHSVVPGAKVFSIGPATRAAEMISPAVIWRNPRNQSSCAEIEGRSRQVMNT
jgi:hypothetical protein